METSKCTGLVQYLIFAVNSLAHFRSGTIAWVDGFSTSTPVCVPKLPNALFPTALSLQLHPRQRISFFFAPTHTQHIYAYAYTIDVRVCVCGEFASGGTRGIYGFHVARQYCIYQNYPVLLRKCLGFVRVKNA